MSRAKTWARTLRRDARAIFVPLGIRLVTTLIPDDVMDEYRAAAASAAAQRAGNAAAMVIVAPWISGAAMPGWIAFVDWRV